MLRYCNPALPFNILTSRISFNSDFDWRHHILWYRFVLSKKMLKSSLVGFMVILAVVHSIELDSRSENTFDLMSGKDHEKLLSRRRRYLVFPEGSSLQLGENWFKICRKHMNKLFMNDVSDSFALSLFKSSLWSDHWSCWLYESQHFWYNRCFGLAASE